MSRALYSLVIALLLPLTPLYLWWRGRRQPAYRAHWSERYARYDDAPASRRAIWVHAVSVGETRAAQPLIAALRERFPQHPLVLTHMTPTGRDAGLALYGDTVRQLYLPYDTTGAAERFLAHVDPLVGLFVETELWPNLIAACARRGVPTALVNARLSAASARGYARFAGLTRATLAALGRVCAQGRDDADRLRQLGAHDIAVTGNLKFDIEPPAAQGVLGSALRARFGDRPVWLCASTREGEEALILAAARNFSRGGAAVDGNAPLLVIVPRHPQRFDEVAALARSLGYAVQRRSEDAAIAPDTEVLVGDSMGEMFAYYAACDVAFVGGSLLDFGCQNLIEPCALGVPVLIGPSTYNFADAAAAALAARAAVQVADAPALVQAARELLGDVARLARMSAAGRAVIDEHRGATARTMAAVQPIIDGAASSGPRVARAG